ncbi:MAG: tetratricopeptide repeat protein [Cytophagales bacterium]|nr:tetratricopeptide repeat protein [Cytophagales bacterium]MDW8384394.1 tetratricopeptide repeat protein [Flammeovirgaceae bacterium]
MKKFLILWLSIYEIAFCQSSNPFFYGKKLLLEGKYESAMTIFESVAKNPSEKAYFPYAVYFYAYCAYQLNKFDEAVRWLQLLQSSQPSWEKKEEAYFLESLCLMEKKEYFSALQMLQKIQDPFWAEDVYLAKKNIYNNLSINDLEANYSSSYQDRAFLEILFYKLKEQPYSLRNHALFEQVIQQLLHLENSPVLASWVEKPNTGNHGLKSFIRVALLLPFVLGDNAVSARSIKNQYVFDLYEGVRIATEILMETFPSCVFNLLVFDTNKDSLKVRRILANPEFQKSNLIIGPLHPNTVPLVKEFSKQYQIPMVNPLSTNPQVIENNPFAFLLHTTPETQAKQAALFAIRYLRVKYACIVYDKQPSSKLLAETFKKVFQQEGGKVELFHVFEVGKQGYKILSDSLQKVSVLRQSCIYAATNDVTTAFNILSASLSLNLNIPILADYSWLEFDQIKFHQIERANVHFVYPQFQINQDSILVKRFTHKYIEKMGILPSKFVRLGFETMYLFGSHLCKNPSSLIEAMRQSSFLRGVMSVGYDYSRSNENEYVPVVKLVNGKLELLNPR